MRTTIFDWKQAREIIKNDPYFHAMLIALILKADTDNLAKLKQLFPEAVAETVARYNAPGGCLSIREWEHEFGGESKLEDTDIIEKQIEQAKAKAGVTW